MPIQARTEFASALNQIASEKGVEVSMIIEAIEQAALAAYKKDLSLRGEEIPEDFDSFTAKVDSVTGGITIHQGDKDVTPPGFARIAAQTAKQVIMQRLNEAEKGAILDEYAAKVGTVISGTIQRQEGNTYFIDLGRAEGVMPPSEQTRGEYYHLNQRLKFFIKEIRESGRGGPEVVLSRADAGLVKGLFAMEVPEIQTGSVMIKDVAREAGGRCKIAAISTQEGVDPVGSLVGQKGVRVQAVIQELGEEKVDIVPFSEDPARFIAAALSPAKDVEVKLEEGEEKVAKVKVPASQLSLAIGRGGQNVRLAAKLTGYKIDIEGTGEQEMKVSEDGVTPAVSDDSLLPEEEAAKTVEENIEAVAEEEGVELPDVPDTEEIKAAAGDAEADMEEDPEITGDEEHGGDLVGTDEPSEEDAPTVAEVAGEDTKTEDE